MLELPPRHAISRARFFLDLADKCGVVERNEFEAHLEASIIFARSALHRLKSEYSKHPNWKPWWDGILSDPSVSFFRTERNWIVKEAPSKIGQIISLGPPPEAASELYYYEGPDIPATVTVRKHLDAMEKLIVEADRHFGSQ